MTIRFAAAAPLSRTSAIARILAARVPLCAANDNVRTPARDRHLREALLLFAKHGLGAAAHAAQSAAACAASGDGEACRHWLSLCGKLDPRLAVVAARRLRRQPLDLPGKLAGDAAELT